MSRPWLKFYPADWRAEPCLRMCSISARGLWIEMLCLMHQADPRGLLLVNGNNVSAQQLSALSGASEKEVVKLLSELEQAGVFSRESSGTIYSRRMRRDEEKGEIDKENGRTGGNPRLKGGVNPQVNGGDKAQILEAEAEESIIRPKRVRTKHAYPLDFEEFWKSYPVENSMSKFAASQVWARLGSEDRSDAISSLPAFKSFRASRPDLDTVHAERYLSKRRWEGFMATQAVISSLIFVAHGTEEWRAWEKHLMKKQGRGAPSMDKMVNGRSLTGWEFPSRWPPQEIQAEIERIAS